MLTGAGIPLEGLALILGLDQLLERVRCVLNVTGDLVAAVVMERFARGKVGRLEEVWARAEVEKRRLRTDEDVVTLPAEAPEEA